jgi:tetratricopeptide (TPR) repeat protein
MHGLIKRGTRLNRIRPALLITALGLMAFAPRDSLAQQPVGNDLTGKRVVPKYRGFTIKIENQVIYPRTIETYRVEQVNGPWLWLYAAGLNGWALADQVVPVEQAIEFFTDYIRSNPGDAHGYTMRAKIWREERKELDIALGDYNEAIRLVPTIAAVYNNRGMVWHSKKEYDKAIADYNEAIRLDPKDALAYNSRGLAWSGKKEYDKAIADYNEAIRLDPKFAIAYSIRGNRWDDKKEYDKAIADYNEAIRLDPKFAIAYSNRGNTWRNKKEYDKAIADYNEAIRLDPKFATAYSNRGDARSDKKEYDKAIADYNEAIRLDPKYAGAYNGRAWLWATCPDAKYRDGKKAVQSATAACELSEWKNSDYLDTLAAANAATGDFDSAVKWQSKAIELLSDERTKEDYRSRLRLYLEKKPYRETKP